ncbi:MAG: hypothetical protein M3P49_12820 [Actinomycetota bacterium]|nr:hypothetical protein [Actinomycetota bacterium]
MARLGRIKHDINRPWDESKVRRDRLGRFARKLGFLPSSMDFDPDEHPDDLADILREFDEDPNINPITGERYTPAEKKLREVGVPEVYLPMHGPRSEGIAHPTAKGVVDAARVGIDKPRGVYVQPVESDDPADIRNIIAQYYPKFRVITVNPLASYWDDPDGESAFLSTEAGWFASTSPKGPLHHEMGHLGHDVNLQKAGHKGLMDIGRDPLPPSLYDKIRETVSIYGTENAAEFVAETFSGLMDGQTYPEDVLELYDWYRGPELVKPRGFADPYVTYREKTPGTMGVSPNKPKTAPKKKKRKKKRKK